VRTVRPGVLAAVVLVSSMAGWLATLWASGNGFTTPSLHLSSLLTVALIIAFTLVAGWRVRRWRDGDRRRPLPAILAARTLVLAQASTYLGALMTGWHAGVFADQLGLLPVRSATGQFWTVLALMLGGAFMAAAGMVVERFCRLPPPGQDGTAENGGRNKPGSEKTSDGGQYAQGTD
jgi:hypothetical protein